MNRISYWLCVWLAVAIGASILSHLAALSPELNISSAVVLLLAVLPCVGAFLADDLVCKWLGIKLEQLRFSLVCLGLSVAIGLMVPRLPQLLEVMR